jgi:adenylosuccinate lyase
MLTKGQIFAEFVLDALIRKGMSRIEAYKLVQSIAFEASNKGIEFLEALKSDERISNIITRDELDNIFNAKEHLGASYIIIKEIADKAATICK